MFKHFILLFCVLFLFTLIGADSTVTAQTGCQPCYRPGKKKKKKNLNKIPEVTVLTLSRDTVTIPCPSGQKSSTGFCTDDMTVKVSTTAKDPENDILTYNYTVSGGRIIGQGANVNWDLIGVQPGTYTITVGVDDGCGVCGQRQTKTVTVTNCQCVQLCECPSIFVTSSAGRTIVFKSTAINNVTYKWSVSNGTIVSGQGTEKIVVSAPPGSSVTATVDIGGLCNACNSTASGEASVLNN